MSWFTSTLFLPTYHHAVTPNKPKRRTQSLSQLTFCYHFSPQAYFPSSTNLKMETLKWVTVHLTLKPSPSPICPTCLPAFQWNLFSSAPWIHNPTCLTHHSIISTVIYLFVLFFSKSSHEPHGFNLTVWRTHCVGTCSVFFFILFSLFPVSYLSTWQQLILTGWNYFHETHEGFYVN